MTFVETFPKGTSFTWRAYLPDWDPDDVHDEFVRIKAMLEARGMRLELSADEIPELLAKYYGVPRGLKSPRYSP